jgi:acetyltransferase-like isoleucine patch superfamily enzyme
VILEALGSAARAVRGLPPRDPRQAKFVTGDSLRWLWRNRAFDRWYLLRYWRLLLLRLRHPDIVTEGMVFIGRRVELHARTGYGRLVLGRWVHVGDENRLRAHEGTLRVGDKCVFGRDNTVNCYLDVEFGDGTIVADWVYICDFDHVYDDIHVPIKDQGIVKSPVRIGPDCWVGAKVTVLRGSTVGRGCVLAAHAVVRGDVPPMSIVGGVPGRVLKDRVEVYEAKAATRAALEDIARKTARAAGMLRDDGVAAPAEAPAAPAGPGALPESLPVEESA